MTRFRCDRTSAWSALRTLHAARGASLDLRAEFKSDPQRFATFSQDAPRVFADLSKNLIDAAIEQELFALAPECGVEQHRDAMFRGDAINTSEQRVVKNFLLRTPLPADGMYRAGLCLERRGTNACMATMCCRYCIAANSWRGGRPAPGPAAPTRRFPDAGPTGF